MYMYIDSIIRDVLSFYLEYTYKTIYATTRITEYNYIHSRRINSVCRIFIFYNRKCYTKIVMNVWSSVQIIAVYVFYVCCAKKKWLIEISCLLKIKLKMRKILYRKLDLFLVK